MKNIKIILVALLSLLMLFLASCDGGQNAETTTGTEAPETTQSSETTKGSNESTSEETTEKETETENFLELVDFIVSVPEEREPVILQLTDTQIIDASQVRTPDRLGGLLPDLWSADKKDVRCYDFLREIITNTSPDLIIITGDIIYGEFDDNGSNLLEFVEFMESFDIPWAPIFGNHDNESKMGADWQSAQFENAENCLFLQRDLNGNGNYTVGIEQGGKLTRVFFMLDSNGVGGASEESLSNGQTNKKVGFGKDQIKWYSRTADNIKDKWPDTKLSFAFHIPLAVFNDAFAKYTTDTENQIFIDYNENKQDGDFGYIGTNNYEFDTDKSVWKGLKKLGVDSIFVGHEHANSASVVYEGVRLQFGMKSSSYDSLNYVSTSGEIEYTVYSTFTPWVGGSVFSLDKDGNIVEPYIYYCENGGAKIDWDGIYAEKEDLENKSVFEIVDFVVEVPEDREPVILQLTDTQIIDASQCRTEDRLSSIGKDIWAAEKKDSCCYDYLREIIEKTNPDLILITGDIIYGEFDDNGQNLLEIIEFFEGYGIPWAPIFGNHDNESKMGVDWQCDQLENAEHCLFLQRQLTGNGNYTVGIKQGDKLTRVFFMLDSNGCGNASAESLANGHTKTSNGFGKDQIKWYTGLASVISTKSPETKFSMAFHIQISTFGEAFNKYGTDGSTDHVFIDYYEDKFEDDFGYIGAKMKGPWDQDLTVWKSILEYNFDSVFVGHEHANSASIVYNGVRLQYGMKSSTYDRNNYIDSYGNISVSDNLNQTPWIGGTVFNLASDGTIVNPHIYYCENAGGNIDWDSLLNVEEIEVEGLQKDTDITTQSGVSIIGMQFDENTTAYEVIADSQGKLYVNVDLLKNKSTFTFTVYLPETSTERLGGMGEFAIRVKPNEIEPSTIDGNVNGYIDYDTESSIEDCRLKYGEWQTFTVNVSSLGEDCTEFAFVLPAGNTIYLKDLIIE